MFCTGSSLVASSGASSCSAFSLRGKGCRHAGFSSWGLQAWFLPACGSSWTRGQTRVPCIGRWILVHCTTREVLTCAVLITGALWLRLSSAGLCFVFFFFPHWFDYFGFRELSCEFQGQLLSLLEETSWNFDRDYIESEDPFGESCHLNNVNSPWT